MNMLHWFRSVSRGEGVMGSQRSNCGAIAGKGWVDVAALLTLALALLFLFPSPLHAVRQRPIDRPLITHQILLCPDLPRDPRYFAYIELWRAPEVRKDEVIVWDSGAETTMVRVHAEEEYVYLPVPITCRGNAGLVRVTGWDEEFSAQHWSTGWWVDQTPFDIPPTCNH